MGGAGRGGGLLFLAVLAFIGYLALTALAGLSKVIAAALLVVAMIALAMNVIRRR